MDSRSVVGWNTAYIIALLIIAVLLIVAFFIIELYIAEYPLVPKSVFNLKIGMVLACISCGWGHLEFGNIITGILF